MENHLLQAALEYLKMGYCVIPMESYFDDEDQEYKKRPHIKWTKYQNEASTDADIKSWWSKWPKAMIGVITGNRYKLVAIDCDSDEAYQKIQELIPENTVTPIASTPRGGKHIWFHPNGDKLKSTPGFLPKTDARAEGGIIIAPPSINLEGKRYSWIVAPHEAALQELPLNIKKYIIYESEGESVVSSNLNTTEYYKYYKILQKGHRDQDLFKIGMSLADGRYKRDELIQVLEILAKNCDPPFPESELQEKIKSVFERISRKERNLSEEVREWTLLQTGYWNTTLILRELQITTKQEIKYLTTILSRLKDEGIIEKWGERRGDYKTVKKQNTTAEMDLLTEELIEEVDIRLPINLNDMCVISPGNIIVVAGSKSSGKTTMMMNIAMMNQNNFDVVYLNSEMSQTEFKKRMKKFAPLDQWKIKGYKCHNNFDDYIENDRKKIFIVDYLEIHDNFFEIAKPIRKIHEKLGDAICIIGIQMRAGAELGRGGEFSAEKARLYLTMDYRPDEKHTMVTIYDAKEPRPPFDNVRGKFRRVKIIDGYKLSPSDNWRW